MNAADADTLAETGNLNTDDLTNNAQTAVKEMLTDKAKEVVREQTAMQMFGIHYDQLNASQGMDVDWTIMGKEAHSFGLMDNSQKRDWVSEKTGQVFGRAGQFMGEIMHRSSTNSADPKSSSNSSQNSGGLDGAVQNLMRGK